MLLMMRALFREEIISTVSLFCLEQFCNPHISDIHRHKRIGGVAFIAHRTHCGSSEQATLRAILSRRILRHGETH